MKIRYLAALALLLPFAEVAKADLCVSPTTGQYITCVAAPSTAAAYTTGSFTGLLSGSGGINLIGTNTLSPSGAYTLGTSPNFLGINSTVTGGASNAVSFAPAYLAFTFTNFTKSVSPFFVPGFEVNTTFGGSGDVGGFIGALFSTTQTTKSGNLAAGVSSSYVGSISTAAASDTEGGTDFTTNDVGSLWGIDTVSTLSSGATFWHAIRGIEADINLKTGATATQKTGFLALLNTLDAVDANTENTGYVLAKNGSASSNGWWLGYSIGNYDGVFPMAATGTVMGAYTHAAAGGAAGTMTNGIDFVGGSLGLGTITFTGFPFRSTGFTVGPTGITTTTGVADASAQTAGKVGEVASIHCIVGAAAASATAVTVTIATPGVVTWSSHTFSPSSGLANYTCPINFTGTPPTGITVGTNYYIDGATVSGDTFQISDTAAHALAGTNHVATSGSDGGTTAFIGAVAATGTAYSAAALRLTAGDWDCTGLAEFQELTALTTTSFVAALDTSIVITGIGNVTQIRTVSGAMGAFSYYLPTPAVRQNVSSTTSVFTVSNSAFSAGTMNQGGKLSCRRMR